MGRQENRQGRPFGVMLKVQKKSTTTVTQLKYWLQSKVQRKEEYKERLM